VRQPLLCPGVTALVTGRHWRSSVVRTTELVGAPSSDLTENVFVDPHWSWQVVAVEPESAPRVLVEKHREVPTAQLRHLITRKRGRGFTPDAAASTVALANRRSGPQGVGRPYFSYFAVYRRA